MQIFVSLLSINTKLETKKKTKKQKNKIKLETTLAGQLASFVKSISIKECYLFFFLPSQKATLLLIPYHFRIPPTSKNSIFIKILLFNLSLLFLSIRYCLGVIPFSWAFQPFFFSQAPSTSSTNHKHKHKQTQTHAD